MAYAIGVDVGATKIALALVTRAGRVVSARQTETRVPEGTDAVIHRIASEVDALAAVADEAILGVGVGVPGLVNPDAGVVVHAVNMGWTNVPLRERVRAQIGLNVPVRVENDLRGAARGEFLFGAARGMDDFVLFSIGSGFGSAAMVHGQVVHGANFFASELGHFVIDPQGRVCTCGLRGCAETVLSGRGLIDTTRDVLKRGIASTLHADDLTTNAILDAARQHDAAACAALEKMGEWLGIVMASASAWLNPARMVLGGGLGLAAFDLLYKPACDSYTQRVL
jgi:glucokinase